VTSGAQPVSRLRVVITTTALRSWVSPSQATALALAGLGAVSVFAGGVAQRLVGPFAPWAVLGVVVAGFALRAVDLESCALFVPGGLYGLSKRAFGASAAAIGASTVLVDTVLLGALVTTAAGHSVAAVGRLLPHVADSTQPLAGADVAVAAAVCVTGIVWWWLRQGRVISNEWLTRGVALSVATIAGLAIWALGVFISRNGVAALRFVAAPPGSVADAFRGIAVCLFAAGSAEALSHVSADVPSPRILNLRRTARTVNVCAVGLTAGITFIVQALLPSGAFDVLANAPLISLLPVIAPAVDVVLAVVLVGATTFFLSAAAYRTAAEAQRLLLRLSEDGWLPRSLRMPHPRFGTPFRLVGIVTVVQVAVIFLGAGQIEWLAKAYGVAVACGAILKIAALVRLRQTQREAPAFRVGFNPRLFGRERPIGLIATALVFVVLLVLLVSRGEPASLAAVAGFAMLAALLAVSGRYTRASAAADAAGDLDLLPAPSIGIDRVNVRPGSILVPVRKPGALAHLAAALAAARNRDVVVMTVRVIGVDVSDDTSDDVSADSQATDDERRLLASAALLAERHGVVVRLLIVPATNVSDAVAAAVIQLHASDVYVGESETLSADDQARLLGDAWERAAKAEPFDVRLVIHHAAGRTAVYHVGAHQPSLTNADLDLIHALWLDVSKAIGPHVHHRDVVRAALTHMEEQLKHEGAERDDALELVRRTTHPGDELASVVRQRDFARLRDMVRNRPPSELAAVLTHLTLEDQVVAFRVLPRKQAAATFEYLSLDAQAALLKAMAQEDVAAILNEMAPDDRTMFLEELPATATQQLLTLLTPQERAVAVTLLGYPENSIGRLMTPDYIAVREQWTVQEVLDYVRAHGQDSETLNMIYVVDDRGVLIDDIRIREFLLNSPSKLVAELMDRRFIALNAADDQNAAVTVFRREDRSALPVTDSAGVLIGIVTIDDVLDVAEAEATKEIQRFGGSEALDEPYMRIALTRMIQKRAGWLTALFLGEMLTATAMGAFEREIERAVVLALFVPLIISSGGNSGSQASTLVIRAIALGEVKLTDWWRVMQREIAAGLALGAILGTIGFLRITIWSAFSTLYGPHWFLVASTVAIALVGVVLWGTLIGSLLPFLLRRLGFDPATSSAPFVATLVDVTGLIIYFSVGIVVLRGTLL